MNIPKWVRWALGLALLLGASSRLKLPMPTGLLDPLIAEVAPGFELRHGRQWLRWGSGELVIEDLAVDYLGERRARIKRVEVQLDLWPWSPDLGMPSKIAIQQPEADLDRELLDALAEVANRISPDDGSAGHLPPWLQVQVRNLALRAVDDAGRRWSTSGIHADIYLDANFGGQLRVAGDVLAPMPGELSLVARSERGLRHWYGDLRANLELRSSWPELNPEAWTWRDGSLELQSTFRMSPKGLAALEASVEIDASAIDSAEPLVSLRDFHFEIEGDLAQGFRFRSRAVETHGELLLNGELRAPKADVMALEDWTLRAFIDAPESYANPENIAWLGSLSSVAPSVQEIADALHALGLNGSGEMHASVGWHPQDLWTWALYVRPLDLELSYRGFVDEEGLRIAAPYPLVEPDGFFAAGGETLMWDAEARAGTAKVHCDGTVDVRAMPHPDVHVAVSVDGLTLDRQAAHAMSGNPNLTARWRELGSPLGGTLDLDMQVVLGKDVQDVWGSIRAQGATGAPLALPVQTTIEDARFDWYGDRVNFRGRIAALGSRAQLRGTISEPEGGTSVLEVHATGAGFRPTAQERLALQGYLRLPDEISDLLLTGDVGYRSHLRVQGDAPPSALIALDLGGADCRDQARDLALEKMRGKGVVAWGQNQLMLLLPQMQVEIPGGLAQASVTIHPDTTLGRVTFRTEQMELDEEFTSHLRRVVGLHLFDESVGLSGTVSMRATMNPLTPSDFRGVLHCEPVLISAVDQNRREVYSLVGDMVISLDRVRANRLRLFNDETELWASGFDLRRGEAGETLLDVRLDSSSGLRLNSNLRQLLDDQARSTLEVVGLNGRIYPRQLAIALRHADGELQLELDGEIEVQDFSLEAAGGVRDGRARLILDGSWTTTDAFDAVLTVSDASATVSGLAFDNGLATVRIDAEALSLEDFEASMLGGTVSSETRNAGGQPARGEIRLGLQGDAPFHAQMGFRGMQMSRMREELAMGGSLSGVVDADVDLTGRAMHTNSLRGHGRISIRDGVLGTVPVLKQIWAFAGVRPPAFDKGTLNFRANGVDRFDIDRFKLEHNLKAVQGKGFVRFDSELHLKVTVRTFGPFGDLPIFRDVLDWFVEQDVRGPVERPVILQRSTSKIFNIEPFVPFPLWVPAVERPDWKRSPVAPVVPTPRP